MAKKQFNIRKNKFLYIRKIMVILTIIALTLIGVGYAYLTSNLTMNGTINVKDYKTPLLYNILRYEYASGGLAREYTGEHHDSFTAEPSKKIYHYYSNNDNESAAILNKNNVIYAGYCWEIYRTTDTGGTKLLYNGIPVNNQCVTKDNAVYSSGISTDSLSGNYWYGTDFEFDTVNNKVVLKGEVSQINSWNDETAPNMIGKYTCKSSTLDGCYSSFYYVVSYNSSSYANVLSLSRYSNQTSLGYVPFNDFRESLGDGGYMYGDIVQAQSVQDYNTNVYLSTTSKTILNYRSLANNFWYADSVTYDTANSEYSLVNPYQIDPSTNLSNIAGKYTFFNSDSSYKASSVYYPTMAASSSGSYYSYAYTFNNGIDMSTYTPMKFGSSISDNGNGTYTINNVSQFSFTDWYNNGGANFGKYYCEDGTNVCANPKIIIYTSSSTFTSYDALEDIMLGKEYNGTQLQDTILVKMGEFLSNFDYYLDYPYTCGTTSNTCGIDDVRVINELGYNATSYSYQSYYYLGDGVTWDGTEYTLTNVKPNNKPDTHRYFCPEKGKKKCTTAGYIISNNSKSYLVLENGKTTLQDILDSTLANNVHDSETKLVIDEWYKRHMLAYSDDLEDTIFCNNRAVAKYGPFAPLGTTSDYFTFYGGDEAYFYDLSCPLVTDQFAVANNQAKLTYKVGMATYPEINLLGSASINGGYYIGNFRVMTPQYFTTPRVYMRMSMKNSSLSSWYTEPVKPVISLKYGTRYATGDGSKERPYFVGETHTITANSELFKYMKKALPGWTVSLESDEYIVTSFKVNGTLVEGESFTMPDADVSITDIQYVVANYSIINTDNSITVPNIGRYKTTIKLDAGSEYLVTSFKMNGTLVEGNTFTMPATDVTLTDIVKVNCVIVESEHDPYPNSQNNVVYYENTFAGATSLTVELTYQTESTNYDWIYLYDSSNGSPIDNKKYGGTTKTTETININSNYLKILFITDSYGNNYYGFKAVIYPNYS